MIDIRIIGSIAVAIILLVACIVCCYFAELTGDIDLAYVSGTTGGFFYCECREVWRLCHES